MEILRITTFIAMVILEAIMMIIIAIKNRNLKGQEVFKIALSLLGVLILSSFLAFKYLTLEGWSDIIGFSFVCVMLLTYLINRNVVSKFNETAYNETRSTFRAIAWISVVAIVLQIIAVMPKGYPHWLSGDFFLLKIN